MRILHARDYIVQPWKNGGGMTTEIIAAPLAASFETFDWRISMARVAAPGPFSMFAGIDRSLALLEGDGIVLDVDGRGDVVLRAGAHPAVFPGDVPVAARLIGGAVLDLNVMTRRGRWRHHLSLARVSRSFELVRRGAAVVAIVRGCAGTAGGETFGDGDAIMLSAEAGDDAASMSFDSACDLWIADLWPMPGG